MLYRLKSLGFHSRVICSDFSHATRSKRLFDSPDVVQLPTITYSGSLTLRRLLSHFAFSLMTFFSLVDLSPRVVYCNVPPNGLLWIATLYVKVFRRKLVVDVVDIWPEALTGANPKLASFSGVFKFAGTLARLPMRWSDYVVLECEKFKGFISAGGVPTKVISLSKAAEGRTLPPTESLSIAYLGGLGNIYDFDSLFKMISEVRKVRDVEVHLLGDGPMRNEFIHQCSLLDITTFDHGVSFDECYKYESLAGCWFGFNMYHSDEFIGLSYKSVDYLSFGLPLLNSLSGDLHSVVEQFNAGKNVSKIDLDQIISYLSNVDVDEVLSMKEGALIAFEANFSLGIFENNVSSIISAVMRK